MTIHERQEEETRRTSSQQRQHPPRRPPQQHNRPSSKPAWIKTSVSFITVVTAAIVSIAFNYTWLLRKMDDEFQRISAHDSNSWSHLKSTMLEFATNQPETQRIRNQSSASVNRHEEKSATLATTTGGSFSSSSDNHHHRPVAVRTKHQNDQNQNMTQPPPTTKSSKNNNNKNNFDVVEFERQDGVVIATKIHGVNQLGLLEQSLCLLHYAYNNRVLYDIVAFTTEPFNQALLEPLRATIAPAQLTVVVDNRGLQAEIRALSLIRRTNLLERCQVSSPETLTWQSPCLGRYNWQAEFRTWHIWKHPALQPYRYMMWIDADGFSTQVWPRDPVAVMLQQQLYILFDNFPQGRNGGIEVQNRIRKSWNRTLCGISLNQKTGRLESTVGGGGNDGTKTHCPQGKFPLIHGFFHITDLDFYRSDTVQQFAENWIGDCFCCRDYDDQAGVTIPVAVLAPDRAGDLQSLVGIPLNIYHNHRLDGKEKVRPYQPSFVHYWFRNGAKTFPQAYHGGKCRITASH